MFISDVRMRLPEAAATVWWKRTSWTRNCSGSSSEANMPATSSAIVAIWSGVARSAARPATAISSACRASNISAEVKPWSEAIRRRGLLSSEGGPSALTTKVPAPCRD